MFRLTPIILRPLLPLLLLPLMCPAQEPAASATLTQEKLRQWIQTKKQIAAEKADWEAEKKSLADLNAIRKQEIAQIDELIAAAGTRLADAEKQRASLLAEETDLRAWRERVEAAIVRIESGLRANLPKFPPPLRDKAGEAIERLENPRPDAPLQNRCRDAIAILSEVGNFESVVTVDTEMREVGGGVTVEVDVLYLGLAQAWYVDRSGRHAGGGVPGADGWRWTENAALAALVRQAIEIERKRAAPALIGIPFSPAAKP